MRRTSFSDEITNSVRVPQTLLVNALVQALAAHAPEAAASTQARLLEVIGDALVDGAGTRLRSGDDDV